MTDGIKNLTDYQKDQLLHFFFHYMPMEQRERLMAELPRCYNAACGSDIVHVRRTNYNDKVTAPLSKCEERRNQTYNA